MDRSQIPVLRPVAHSPPVFLCFRNPSKILKKKKKKCHYLIIFHFSYRDQFIYRFPLSIMYDKLSILTRICYDRVCRFVLRTDERRIKLFHRK